MLRFIATLLILNAEIALGTPLKGLEVLNKLRPIDVNFLEIQISDYGKDLHIVAEAPSHSVVASYIKTLRSKSKAKARLAKSHQTDDKRVRFEFSFSLAKSPPGFSGTTAAAAQRLKLLHNQAKENNWKIESHEDIAGKIEDTRPIREIVATGQGSYRALTGLLYGLNRSPYALRVRDLQLLSLSSGSVIRGSIVIEFQDRAPTNSGPVAH